MNADHGNNNHHGKPWIYLKVSLHVRVKFWVVCSDQVASQTHALIVCSPTYIHYILLGSGSGMATSLHAPKTNWVRLSASERLLCIWMSSRLPLTGAGRGYRHLLHQPISGSFVFIKINAWGKWLKKKDLNAANVKTLKPLKLVIYTFEFLGNSEKSNRISGVYLSQSSKSCSGGFLWESCAVGRTHRLWKNCIGGAFGHSDWTFEIAWYIQSSAWRPDW